MERLNDKLKHYASKSIERLLVLGFVVRLVLVVYSIFHDHNVDHIKYTDIDYHVFTDGARAVSQGNTPYRDSEYRYPPIVAITFLPNILINESFGKLILILVDIVCAHLIYRLNISQGTHRLNSKMFLILWLFNPVTIAISTRGSFEPILILAVLTTLYLLTTGDLVYAGLMYGISIHLKLYPIIYALSFYIYITQRKPLMKNQSKLNYWLYTLKPTLNHFKFFIASGTSLVLFSLLSYHYYGYEYLEQSFLYHLKRKDLQHNFSIYFYIFRLFSNFQDEISTIAFITQFASVLTVTVLYAGTDTNRRVKLRKLSFSMFCSTLLFVSLNKVCTAQYFNWYLIFLPLIMDCIKIRPTMAYRLVLLWSVTLSHWLLHAYLYEYQSKVVIESVFEASIIFLLCNISILVYLCRKFNPSESKRSKETD